MPNLKSVLFLSLSIAALPAAHAAGFWQPLCPDGAVCATASEAFVGNGHVLLTSKDTDLPSQWIDVATHVGSPTAMRDIALVTGSGNYMATSGPNFAVYDTGGNLLYNYNHSSIESYIVFENHATALGPAVIFAGTTPATILTGLTLTGQAPFIYLSQDEGQTVKTQLASLLMSGGRTNFVVSPDSQRIWAIPGPATAGLWQTPAAAGAAKLDFTQLTRVDDGSFPADVLQFRVIANNANVPGGYSVALASDGMYISTNSGRTWTPSAFTGAVDDIAFPVAGSPDVQAISARGGVFLSRDRGATWSAMGRGLPYDHYMLSAVNGSLVADSASGVFGCNALDCAGASFGPQSTVGTNISRVTEFQNLVLDHYFITADESEKAAIRSGAAGPGWVETGQQFWAWTPNVTRESALVCRFYGDFVIGPNSHFYSASTDECRQLLGLQLSTPDTDKRWNTEGYAFKVSLPVAGHCASGLVPIYRAYNDGFAQGIDSNHRYVVDRSLLTPLIAKGWKDEGVAFCVPATQDN